MKRETSKVKTGGKELSQNQAARKGLRVRSNVKAGNDAGRIISNHNQAVVRTASGLGVESSAGAGGKGLNHRQTTAR